MNAAVRGEGAQYSVVKVRRSFSRWTVCQLDGEPGGLYEKDENRVRKKRFEWYMLAVSYG